MSSKNRAIGVMDSGIGGLTVVKQLQAVLPGEDIIYFGDSANCPYGNKTSQQIIDLSKNMLAFLEDNNVKVTAIACNTISTLAEQLSLSFSHEIIGIVAPTAKYIAENCNGPVGLIATEFTVSTKNYDKLIAQINSNVQVVAKGSPLLASLVDRGDFNQQDINDEITLRINDILSRQKVDSVILGCTHYPIVEENFKQCYPSINFINPALQQALAVKAQLEATNELSQKQKGSFTICTSGDPQVYVDVAKRLNLFEADALKVVSI